MPNNRALSLRIQLQSTPSKKTINTVLQDIALLLLKSNIPIQTEKLCNVVFRVFGYNLGNPGFRSPHDTEAHFGLLTPSHPDQHPSVAVRLKLRKPHILPSVHRSKYGI